MREKGKSDIVISHELFLCVIACNFLNFRSVCAKKQEIVSLKIGVGQVDDQLTHDLGSPLSVREWLG